MVDRLPYNTSRWQRLRLLQLEAHPLCKFCEDRGQVTPANVCDHVEPHKGDLAKFWQGPFQSLCKRCHDSDKQRMERGGKAKPKTGLDGWPE
jgi:5-methylcytosine-specific restriction enzyme A